jgi:hypothetical protein
MHTIPVRPYVVLKLATFAILAFALLFLTSCDGVVERGNGTIVTESRQIPAFTNLIVDGAFDITWGTGAPALTITTDENLMKFIGTRVEKDSLRLDWTTPLKGTRGIKVHVTGPGLRRITLNGAVRLKGSGLAGTELYLEANGASRITLEGSVNAMSAEMNGASRLDAESLITRATELSINGAGRAEVHASEVLKAEIAGAGKVVYSGDPQTVDRQISGAGSIKRRHD